MHYVLFTICTMNHIFCINNSYHLCLYGVEVFSQLDEPFIIVRILWGAPAEEEKTRQTQRVVQRLVQRFVQRLPKGQPSPDQLGKTCEDWCKRSICKLICVISIKAATDSVIFASDSFFTHFPHFMPPTYPPWGQESAPRGLRSCPLSYKKRSHGILPPLSPVINLSKIQKKVQKCMHAWCWP